MPSLFSRACSRVTTQPVARRVAQLAQSETLLSFRRSRTGSVTPKLLECARVHRRIQ